MARCHPAASAAHGLAHARPFQDGDAAERKYAPATFEAAGAAVSGLLRLLAGGGFYAADDLAPGLLMAQQAEVELPRCAVGAVMWQPLCKRSAISVQYRHMLVSLQAKSRELLAAALPLRAAETGSSESENS